MQRSSRIAMTRKELPPVDVLTKALIADPETGSIKWRESGKRQKAGDEAGCPATNGYRLIGVGGGRYLAHRIMWKITFGTEPPKVLDHINRNRSDNRISNLREVTMSQNMHNRSLSSKNTSGATGVWFVGWTGSIRVDGKRHFIGNFPTKEEAEAAVEIERQRLIALH